MNGLTLDQFAVFVAIVEEGSFAAAARRLNRAQSAITYAVQKLEEQSGLVLFDRSAYRAVLTEAGNALLPRARRILDDVADYRLWAGEMAKGLEAELTLVIDAYTPAALLARALDGLRQRFPRLELWILVEPFEPAARALRDGIADVGLLVDVARLTEEFERSLCGIIELVAVAAPHHPLARLPAAFSPELLREHTQLVLSTRGEGKSRREYGVHAVNRWRVTDLDTKHDLLLAGIGWGSMPRPRVADDLAAGRLVELRPERWAGADRMPELPLVVAHAKARPLGPAGRWLVEQLKAA
jgi:DNA-binding transcriptional LysR family regulator